VARNFSSASNSITLPSTTLPALQNFTAVAVCRVTTNPGFAGYIFGWDSSSSSIGALGVDSAGNMRAIVASSSGIGPTSAISSGATDGWILYAITKTSGTTTIRFHRYLYASDTWARGNSTSTAANSLAPNQVRLGNYWTGSDGFTGDLAAAAIFNATLTDDQVSSLPFSSAAWLSLAPVGMWVLDQSNVTQTVIDWTGGGTNETARSGSAVSTASVPILGYGHPVILRTRQAPPNPQLAASYYLPFTGNNASTLTTPSFTPANGEVIVVKMQTWATGTAMGSVTGGSQTWTSQVVEAPGGFNGWVGISTTTITGSPGSMTVSATPAASCGHSMVVERWTNAQLAATPAVGSGTAASSAPSATVTTTAANSVVSWLVYDNNNRDPSARAYLSSAVDEALDDNHTGTNGVTYYAYQQAPSAGSQTIGLSAPNTMQWVIAGIEIQAPSAGGGSQNGAAALTSASSLTAGATKAVAGAVGMTAGSSLTGGATQATTGACTMSAASSMAVAATKVQPGAVAMSAASSATTSATVVQPGAVTMSAASALSASPTQNSGAAVAMGSASSLTTAAVLVQPGAVGMTAASSVTASASQTSVAVVAMSSASALTIAGTRVQPGAVSMTSASALAADATSGAATGSTMTAASSLTAGAGQTSAAAVAMAAASSLTATGVRVQPGTATMSAASSLSAAGTLTGQGASVMSASSSLTAAGTTTTGGTGAILNAASAMTVSAAATGQGAAALSAVSSLSANAGGGQSGAATLSAASSLSADAVRSAGAAALMNAASSLSAAGLRIVIGAADMSATSTLTAAGSVTSGGTGVAMTSASSLTAGAFAQQAAAVAMSAISSLTAGANLGLRAQVAMTAASSLSATVYVPPAFYQPGILTAGSTRSAPTAGTIPYPRLTAGTVRGPTYPSGGGG
jgi:hypothetical protein